MQVNININKRVFAPKFYPLLFDYSHRFEGYKGSAGSGKSYFITQKILLRCLKEPIRVVVCRKYGTTIRNTCFALFKEVLTKWGLLSEVKIRESDFNIKFNNGSEIIFMGLDEETKLLSLTNITCIFVEEVYELEQEIFDQLNLRLRGGVNQQILFAFNPISQSHWLYQFCVVAPPASFTFSESTYKDNPFLSQEYIQALEELKDRNPLKYRIYALGEWGNDPEGQVFRNYEVEEFNVQELLNKRLEYRVGSDLGFIDPTTIVCSLYDKANNTIYVFDCYYKTGQQLDQVAQAMSKMELKHVKIYMDSAEPRSIEYFKQKGFNAVPCIKGAGSVQARITFLQNNKIVVLPKCQDLINELDNFSYIKDKHTGKYTENTTHEYSHAIDALGYAYSDIYTNNRLRTLDKSVLGL